MLRWGEALVRRASTSRKGSRRSTRIAPFLFIAPWAVGLLLWYVYPLAMTVYYGMTDFDGLNPPEWVGFDNFADILTDDPVFWDAVGNTLWWVFVNVPVSGALALLLAVVLKRDWRGAGLMRTIVYLPSMIPAAGATLLFLWILHPVGGIVNNVGGALGVPMPSWFNSPDWSKPALLLQSLWGVGGMMIIFLAGLQAIPDQLYEAARIDGAGRIRQFWHVTLPESVPTIFFNLTLAVIASVTYFGPALIASSAPTSLGGGGATTGIVGNPAGSTLMLSVYIYQQLFIEYRFGYAAALCVIMAVAVIIGGGALFLIGRHFSPRKDKP
ncbi:MAG: carbohydrate ABC transporter permease [Devosia sp.]